MKMDVEKLLKEKASDIDKTIEKYIPRKYEKDSLFFRLSPPRFAYDLEALNKGIAEPFWEFLDRGGKRWRPVLFLLICEALGGTSQKLLDFAIIPEVIHNGTLIIDDIEDNSDTRRGKPCTYLIYGIDIATNLGNALYYLPLLALIKNKNNFPAEKVKKIYEIYVEEMIKLSFGQAMDITWQKGQSIEEIEEEQYLQMCISKTGTLTRMSAKMAAVLADASDDQIERIGRFSEAIGVAFQIQDDILDLVGEKFAKNKGGYGKDITEGKRTLMIIHTMKVAKHVDKNRLTEILRMHTTDQKIRDEAIDIIMKYHSIEYAKKFARSLINDSWKEIDRFIPSSDAKEKLIVFTNYLVERDI